MAASGFGPRKGKTPTSAASSSSYYQQFKDIVVTSEWYFLPEGVLDVFNRFMTSLTERNMHAEPQWIDETYSFQIKCLRSEVQFIWPLFHKAMTNIITEELAKNGIDKDEDNYNSDSDDSSFGCATTIADKPKEGEPIRSKKIQRLDYWLASNSGVPGQHISEDVFPGIYPTKLSEFAYKATWVCGEGLNDVVSEEAIRQLTVLTGCCLIKLNDGKIYIGSDSEETIHDALAKLNIVKLYSVEIESYENHLFYAEGHTDYKLSLNYITDVKLGPGGRKRLFQTCLLDNLDVGTNESPYRQMHKSVTVRLAPLEKKDQYTAHRTIKCSPALVTKSSSTWPNCFTYNPRGSEADIPLHFNTAKETQKPEETSINVQNNGVSNEHIRNWRADVPIMEPEPVSSLDFFVQPQPIAPPPIKQPPAWDTAARYNPETSTLSGLEKAAMIASRNTNARPASVNTTASPTPQTPAPQTPAPQLSATQISLLELDPDLQGFEVLEMFLNIPRAEIVDEHTDLIDLSETVSDALQATSEVSTRLYRNTILRAPRPKVQLPMPSPPRNRKARPSPSGPPDPQLGFVKQLATTFQCLMMNKLRGFTGNVTVGILFGRILVQHVNPKIIANKTQRDNHYDANKVTELLGPLPFPGHRQAATFFQKKLTQIPGEVSFLQDIKGIHGDRLWNITQSHWEVKYQFIFEDFEVEMDAETFNTAIVEPQEFGNIYIHGTKRSWDMNLTAFGKGKNEALESKHLELVKELKKSLYIPKGLNAYEPKLAFTLKDDQAVPNEIRVHLIKQYDSKGAKTSYLKVDEVLKLQLKSRLLVKKRLRVFDASWSDVEELGKWVEVSIHSYKADELLKENQKLGIGEEVNWKPQDFFKAQVVPALINPACSMLKEMDGVGFHNNNGQDIKEALAMMSETASRTTHTASKPEVFW